jgi:adenylate kinase
LVENNDNIRVIIVGVPGVGKTSIISQVSEDLRHKGHKVKVAIFGTIMLEEADKIGVKNRDDLRKLSLEKQRHLQEMAAKRIAELHDNIVIIDTHLSIKTIGGYYPGLPMKILDIIKPTHIVMVVADATEILNRRKNDTSRNRDILSSRDIQYELDILQVMVASSSILTGSPFTIIMNNDNKFKEAVSNIVKVLCEE